MSAASSLSVILAMRMVDNNMPGGGLALSLALGRNSLLVLCLHWIESSQFNWLAVLRPLGGLCSAGAGIESFERTAVRIAFTISAVLICVAA